MVAALQEIKAKEMEELAKTLAELGIAAPAAADEEGAETAEGQKKKKKKDKKPKATEVNGEVPLPETNGTAKENEPVEEAEEEESSESIDPAEVSGDSYLGYKCKVSASMPDASKADAAAKLLEAIRSRSLQWRLSQFLQRERSTYLCMLGRPSRRPSCQLISVLVTALGVLAH